MGDIFISYSRHDAAVVDQFVEALTQAGIKAWVDREDIKVGNSWRVQIVEAIDGCDAFVLMLSSKSVVSTNVHKEVILAQDSHRPTYVVMLEVVRLASEIRYQLAGLQFINVPLMGFEKSAEKLIESLQPHVKKNDASSKKQVELVIQGVDLAAFDADKQAQLLAFISNLSNTDASQLKIANMTAGSVHVFVDMPASTAFQLKTLALNSDPRFSQLGIVSLKINGSRGYIRISDGSFTPNATNSVKRSWWMRILAALILVILMALFFLSPALAPTLGSSPTPSVTAVTMESATPSPEVDLPATEIPSATATDSPIPTITETSTAVVSPVASLPGVVDADQLSCRYGPGAVYLYHYALIKDYEVDVLGRAETAAGTWLYVRYDGYDAPCWANAKFIQVDGEVASLEIVYPGKVELLLFHHNKFPPVKNVSAARREDGTVEVLWRGYDLALGDRESADSPLYLIEAWTCQDGKLVFNAIGVYEEGALIQDEAGCAEPSHGDVYVAHKDGYIGPVPIPWPAP